MTDWLIDHINDRINTTGRSFSNGFVTPVTVAIAPNFGFVININI